MSDTHKVGRWAAYVKAIRTLRDIGFTKADLESTLQETLEEWQEDCDRETQRRMKEYERGT